MSITVQGYSGCGIIVRPRDPHDPAEAGCHHVVEKSTPDSSYDARLVKQIDKQEDYAVALAAAGVARDDAQAKRTPAIVIPRVLFRRQRLNDAGQPSLVVGMTFEHHVDCVGFLSTASPDKVHFFVDALMQLLQRHVAASPMGLVPTAVLSNKMADIQRVCKANARLAPIVDTLGPMLESLARWIDASPEGHAMPLGVCHGDLTLSNVLIQHGPSAAGSKESGGPCDAVDMKIVLIDFLDSFVETPLADMAKLCQDLVYGWTLRSLVAHQSVRVDLTRIYIAYGVAHRALLKLFGGYDWFKRYFRFFFLVNQLRVLQYCKTDDDRTYLFASVKEQYTLWAAETEPGTPANVR